MNSIQQGIQAANELNDNSLTKEKATMATMTKISTRLTPGLAALLVDMQCVVRLGESAVGVEIRDTRPLVDRIESPIEGRGVVRYLGDTHFIVTNAMADKLKAKSLPAGADL